MLKANLGGGGDGVKSRLHLQSFTNCTEPMAVSKLKKKASTTVYILWI